MTTLVRTLDTVWHVAVEVFVFAITPQIELTTELIWGAPEEGAE